MFPQLLLTPFPQLLHQRTAPRLMICQPLIRRHPLCPRRFVVSIHLAQRLQYVLAFRRKVGRYFHKISSAMSEAVGQQHLHAWR